MSTPESPAALPHFLTTRQVAEALRCSPQTVRNWCKRGLLPPPLCVGRRKRLWDAGLVYQALARLQRVSERAALTRPGRTAAVDSCRV